MSVAKTILQQLGGNKFLVMTGAKNLIDYGDKNALSFRISSRLGNGINYVKVTLNASDLYDIEFGKIHGMNYKVIKTESGIYNSDLQKIFTKTTGLDTHL